MKNSMYLFLFSLTWLTVSMSAMELPSQKRKLGEIAYLQNQPQNKKRKIDRAKKLNSSTSLDTLIAKKLLKLDPFALHEACKKKQDGLIGLLINYGAADVNKFDEDKNAPLHIAIKFSSFDSFKALLSLDADINIKNSSGQAPLHLVSEFKNVDIAESLIEFQANLNIQDENGDTPLHKAVLHHHLTIARLLLVKGALVNMQNNLGNTPLHTQALSYNNNIQENTNIMCLISVLLSMRSDKTLQNQEGKTAKDLLPKNIDPEIYEIFENE